MGASRGILAAHQPLVVPMLLRLSHFKLNSYIVLVVSKQKGITLVFKTDPLQNVDVNSTFDSIAVIQKFIQKEIEGQLREMFREDLPGIIHRLSQRWTAGKAKVEAPYLQKNPQTMYRENTCTPSVDHPPLTIAGSLQPTTPRLAAMGLRPLLVPRPMSMSNMPMYRPRLSSAHSLASTSRLKRKPIIPPSQPSPTEESTSSFPDLENFDPTYGLRPEGLPTKSGYSGFGKLFAADKGLGELVEEHDSSEEYDADPSFDVIDWEDAIPESSTRASSVAGESVTEYETLPAVGGGTISRPRVYHSQSLIQMPEDRASTASRSPTKRQPSRSHAPSSARTPVHPLAQSYSHPAPSPLSHSFGYESPLSEDAVAAWRAKTFQQNPDSYFPQVGVPGPSRMDSTVHAGQSARLRTQAGSSRSPLYHPFHVPASQPLTPLHTPDMTTSPLRRGSSSDYTHPSRSSSGPTYATSTPPSSYVPGPDEETSPYDSSSRSPGKAVHERRRSLSPSSIHPFDSLRVGSPPRQTTMPPVSPGIILRPNLNNTVQHLSSLSLSNHTLSPYTHSPQHFTARSGPPRQHSHTQGSSRQSQHLEKPPVKARRKRTFRVGGKKTPADAVASDHVPASRSTSSQFSDEDVDHYFRTREYDQALLRRRPSHVSTS